MSLRDLEAELIGEKRWTLKGEVKADKRPRNAVLEELDIEFPRNKVHEFTTATDGIDGAQRDPDDDEAVKDVALELEARLEKMIKKRICQKLFDNVQPCRGDVPREADTKRLNPFSDEVDTNPTKKTLTEEHVERAGMIPAVQNNNEKEAEKECLELWERLRGRLSQLVDGFYVPPPIRAQVKDDFA